MTKFETYNPIDAGGVAFLAKTGVLQQFWDMAPDEIRSTRPTGLKLI